MRRNAKRKPKSVLPRLVNGPIGKRALVLKLVAPDLRLGHGPVPSQASALARHKKLWLVMKPSVHQKLIPGSRGDSGLSVLNLAVSAGVNAGHESATATAATLRVRQTSRCGGARKKSSVTAVVKMASGLTGTIGQPVKVAVQAVAKSALEIAHLAGANVPEISKKRFPANQTTAT